MHALIVVVASFAAWLLVVAAHRRVGWEWLRRGPRHWITSIRSHPTPFLLTTMATTGVAVGVMLIQEDFPRAGDFTWPMGAALILAGPLLIALIRSIDRDWLRTTAWVLLTLHVASGTHHLLYTITERKIF